MTKEIELKIKAISADISEAGYDPYSQIYGYLKYGDLNYITRNKNARKRIQAIQKTDLNSFMRDFGQSIRKKGI